MWQIKAIDLRDENTGRELQQEIIRLISENQLTLQEVHGLFVNILSEIAEKSTIHQEDFSLSDMSKSSSRKTLYKDFVNGIKSDPSFSKWFKNVIDYYCSSTDDKHLIH